MPDIKVLNELTIKKNGVSTTYKLGTVNGYYNSADGKFYEDSAHTTELEGAPNLVYADIAGNSLYIYKTATSSFVKVSGEGGGSADNLKFGYLNSENGKFYEDDQYQVEIPGNADYLFIGLDNDTIYRYDTSETAFVAIGGGGGGSNYTAGFGINISNDNEISTTDFVGTQAEWDALTATEKAAYDFVHITDDITDVNYSPGHTISDGTSEKTQREVLEFNGFDVTDDSVNGKTKIAEVPYTAGKGVEITNKEIAVDESIRTTFIGTQAEWNALTTDEKAEYELVNITDDAASGAQVVVDEVTEGNMNAASSNAVAKAINGKVIGGNTGSTVVPANGYIFRYYLYEKSKICCCNNEINW